MARIPDFIGNWMIDNPSQGLLSYLWGSTGDFSLFVDKADRRCDGKSRIRGRIEDEFGSATFRGEISDDEIKFTKRYSRQAIRRGAAPVRIEYIGRKSSDSFRGVYVFTSKGIKCEGTFYVVAFDDLKRN